MASLNILYVVFIVCQNVNLNSWGYLPDLYFHFLHYSICVIVFVKFVPNVEIKMCIKPNFVYSKLYS